VTPNHNEPTLVADDGFIPASGTSDGFGGESAGHPVAAPNGPGRWVREAVVVILVALVVAFLLRTFVVQTFFIPSGSMEPTLQIGDRILVNKLSYHLHGVDRGDIIVFKRPAAENCGGPPVADLVKRVIGLPGETISASGGYVDINGKRLNETWLPASEQGMTGQGPAGTSSNLAHPYRIPKNNYFVMGDNRKDSCDSRYWGPVSRSLIVGKVELRVWPLTAIHLF
jgi:signal peptidase I